MEFDGKKIGMELRALRVKNKISVDEICEKLDIHECTLYKCERDASRIRLGTLEKLLKFYGINTFIFFELVSEYNQKKEE